ncbi:hypothetical protein D5R95_00685, partial [Methanosalsum natronophilum]
MKEIYEIAQTRSYKEQEEETLFYQSKKKQASVSELDKYKMDIKAEDEQKNNEENSLSLVDNEKSSKENKKSQKTIFDF